MGNNPTQQIKESTMMKSLKVLTFTVAIAAAMQSGANDSVLARNLA